MHPTVHIKSSLVSGKDISNHESDYQSDPLLLLRHPRFPEPRHSLRGNPKIAVFASTPFRSSTAHIRPLFVAAEFQCLCNRPAR